FPADLGHYGGFDTCDPLLPCRSIDTFRVIVAFCLTFVPETSDAVLAQHHIVDRRNFDCAPVLQLNRLIWNRTREAAVAFVVEFREINIALPVGLLQDRQRRM